MDWKEYNEKLVRRGELLLDLEFLRSWDSDLSEMNRGKVGRPYTYPDTFFRFLGVLHVLFHLPFRQLEGFVRGLCRFIPELKKPDHATIHRRVSGLDLDLDESLVRSGEPVVIAVDASGVRVTNRGEWLRRKWRRRRGYLKIHFAVDVSSKEIVAFEVTTEEVGDTRMFKPLVEEACRRRKVAKVLADAAYDSRDNFNLLYAKGIPPGIKIKRGYSGRARSKGRARKKAILELERLGGYDAWKKHVDYGKRWISESAFSRFKRLFGECVKAKKFENMAKEIALKVFTYNLLINL